MNFKVVDDRGDRATESGKPVQISMREVSAAEAKSALGQWLAGDSVKGEALQLFGRGASKSWTFVILTALKPKVHEIEPGRLAWILRTALPLRDDFKIYLNEKRLMSSKEGKGRLIHWVIGKDLPALSKPAPNSLTNDVNRDVVPSSPLRYALKHPKLGRITGYVEAYQDLLTGKSEAIGRSYGFFVYVRGRLVNVDDGHFGIEANELRHGSFGRMRIVAHIDGLDPYLQSDRERFREGPELNDTRNLLRAIFNRLRSEIAKADEAEAPGAKLARAMAGSPASVSRRPIISLVRAVLDGQSSSTYISVPTALNAIEKAKLLKTLEARSAAAENFVTSITFDFELEEGAGLAQYQALDGSLRMNARHPFVALFYEEFTSASHGLPLEHLAMAEVLFEAHLHTANLSQKDIDRLLALRDAYFRDVARSSSRRSALAVSNALIDARNDSDLLEQELVASFNALGFDAVRYGQKSRPDGVAHAPLSADSEGIQRRYSVCLEAKSKVADGASVSAATVNISLIASHRDKNNCDHALVVAPAFQTTGGDGSSLALQIKARSGK